MAFFLSLSSLGTLTIKLDTNGGTTQKNAQKQNKLRDRMRSLVTIGLNYFPLSTQEELQRFYSLQFNTDSSLPYSEDSWTAVGRLLL